MTVEREINLASVYRVVWDRGKRILMVTVATMIVAFLITLVMTKRYGATAEVEIKPSRIGERAMAHWVTPVEVYARYIEGDDTWQGLIDELDLDRKPFNIRKPKKLVDRVDISKYKETSVIQVYAEMETPEMAATLANTLAQRMIDKNLQFLAEEAETTAELLERSLSARLTKDASLEFAYLTAKKEYAIDVWQKHLENLISRWQTLISQQENLTISTLELAKRLSSLDEALTHQPEKFELKRTLSEDLVLLEAIRNANPDQTGADLANLSVTIESINQQHYALLSQKDLLQAQLDGDTAKLTLIESLIPQLKTEIDEIQDQIYVGQLEVTRLKAEYDRSYEIFGGIDKQYGWTPTTVFSERYDIAIINPAIAPPKDRIARPNRPAIVVLSGSLAFLLTLVYFLLRDLYGIARWRETAA